MQKRSSLEAPMFEKAWKYIFTRWNGMAEMDKEVTWLFSFSCMLSETYKQNKIQSGADFTPTEIRNPLAWRCLSLCKPF